MSSMRLTSVFLAFAAATTGSAVAHANRLKVESYKTDETTGVIELSAKDPIGEPWMRFEHGEIRIWFPDIDDINRFDRNDGEHPIRSVRLRYGSDNTAVLKVDLNDRKTLRKDDIEIVRNGPHATIAIHAVRKAVAKPQLPVQAQVEPKPAQLAPQPAPAIAPAPLHPSSYKQPLPAATRIPSAPAKKPHPSLHFSAEHPGFGSSVGALILTAVGLGGIYGFIRLNARRQRTLGHGLAIQVLSTRRIGHRHQLVLVRALGQDHLLSLHGGRAECLSSVASPANTDQTPPEQSATRSALGLFAPLLGKRKPWEALANETDDDKTKSSGGPFSDELLGFVRNQARRNASKAPAADGVTTSISSEAVAGIARLRNRALS
jgi:flagellar biogenesis protein FliO